MTLTEREAIFVGLGQKRRQALKRDERLKREQHRRALAKLRKMQKQAKEAYNDTESN